MKPFLAALLLLAALAAGYYYFLYPPKVLERKTAKALAGFAEVVATKDQAKIGAALQGLLGDKVSIRLEVRFLALTGGGAPVTQDFDKASFVTFIDNILFTLTDYAYHPTLDTFTLNEDGSAAATFSSQDWAEGQSYYAGTGVAMRFTSDTTCQAQLVFHDKQPVIDRLTCQVNLHTAPKPGQEDKLKNPEMLKQLLR